MDKIIAALTDDNVHTIGVYGMGGVGKTMLVKEISKLAMEKKLLDEVVTSTVSQTPDLKRIQGQLGDKLGLRFDQQTEEGRALKLLQRLKMERQKILIVLDDVWKQIDLERIGIPSIEDHNGCKILFTSRDNDVLFNDRCTDKNFKIEVLQGDETWNLFRKMAGEIVETSDFKSIAVKIVKECAHLPIAITTVTRALGNKPTSAIWEDALTQLKNPVDVDIRGMNEKVYSSLKLSYDYLDSKEAKSLFLLCSMFPEDYIIDCQVLHVYAMGMGLLHGVDHVAQARHRITKLVDDLISSSLLLVESNDDWDMYVKMHDIVRDVAIKISSQDDRICTLSNSKGLLDEKKIVGNHTAVYLNVEGNLHNLPQKLMLPKIQLLVLCVSLLDKYELPETFFEEMKEMRVLEIRTIKMPLLSPSLYSLTNLQSLHLFHCELENIDVICELNKLENLSIKGSKIIQIPATISQLTQLKVLDLSKCYQLNVIPPNILVNLTKLEELYLLNFDGWESEELNQGRRNASISELSNYLSQLCALALHIPNEKVMPKELFSRFFNLEKFQIFIGHKPVRLPKRKFSNVLSLNMETTNSMDKGINMLLKMSERLYLVGSIGARVFPFELNENESSHLKYLYIENSNFQHFIHGQNKDNLQKVLSNVEDMELSNLENLESFFHGDIREFSFNKLKVIKLFSCNKLGNPFLDSNMNAMLLHLEKINIIDCEKMKTIILMESENPTDPIVFTNLKCLRLNRLPQLQSFYSKIENVEQLSPDQEPGKDDTSRNFNDGSLFNEQVSLPNLEDLDIKEAHNLKMIWCNVPIPNSFSKLKSVFISKCDNLEKVFPSSMMSKLTCLQSLRIFSCKLLEGVFDVQEPGVTNKDIDLLPNLRDLILIGLPKLQFIWGKNGCEFLNFKSIGYLSIYDCPKLETKYSLKVLDNLISLEIDLRRLEEILNKESVLELDLSLETSKDGGELFGKLKFLDLCGSLSPDYKTITHLPMEIVSILLNLQHFTVGRTFLEDIFPMTRLGNVEEWQNKIFKLSYLTLKELPKLRHLWNEDLQKNSSMLQNLEFLSIRRCGILNMFVPSSISFRNLVRLEVMECHKLTYLLNPSVARTMGQLRRLAIRGCKRMTSVIAKEENDEILFNKLQFLVVVDLPKLQNFHSGKCTIRFPVLEEIEVQNCPEMKDFCTGIVSTPHLLIKSIGLYDHATIKCIRILKDYSEENIVKDINVAIRQVWENHYDFNLHCLFEVENLKEENQCESSSHVERLE